MKKTKFEIEMEAERKKQKGKPVKPTDEMLKKQREYMALLEKKKWGDAPLFWYADGREYK